jgi:hypothetical protein
MCRTRRRRRINKELLPKLTYLTEALKSEIARRETGDQTGGARTCDQPAAGGVFPFR